MVSTYLPEENAWYYKTISVIGGETMKSAFERASEIPYLCGDRDEISSFDADFIDRLWLLGMTLVLIMASGESLLETGVRLKTVKSKKVLTNLWSIGRRTIWVGFTRQKPKLAT